ncbi:MULTISPECIES: hypothetical protein [Janthinobacterium]|uniref:hypothetical protein n=1 Tax=Janthinobacterium TaxID=29580 RepID=UPI000C0FDF2C|nr:hypothetical protein [Janthinobacterium sp. BJB401]NVI85068.1 hypothetical protein [Janthinobacterium sp. BJB401]PHV31148.1 hypothetical protein CSQ94_22945 [Janthinobacterium sp. BJB312]
MKKIDIFVCSDAGMRACASWEEAFDAFPVTGITLPGELDFASLGQLLTQSAEPVLRPLRIEGRDIHVFNDAIAQAIGRMADDDLLALAVAWSRTAPWADLNVQPCDLAGLLMELKSNWHRSATPDKALFAWVDA